METTLIAWTDRTWNPWRGCTKISPGCKNCYMFTAQRRYGRDPSEVIRTSEDTWKKPTRWQREAAKAGRTDLVFTCSWSDWFHVDADGWRDEAWAIIKNTPNLHYQILTKRADRIAANLPDDWGGGYDNVWLGVSIENMDYAYRADELRTIPAAVRFISYEPALGPLTAIDLTSIDWVIFGGESGPHYREADLQWSRDMRDKCAAEEVAYFHKQASHFFSERLTTLDGVTVRAYPTPRQSASFVERVRSSSQSSG
jgi:protein gp37